MSRRRTKQSRNGKGSEGNEEDHGLALLEKLRASTKQQEHQHEVELLEKEIALLRYQVRLKEHWHRKSLKDVKHSMEEELHELQKDLIYSFEVAQACIKLELESNEKEEAQAFLAFAHQLQEREQGLPPHAQQPALPADHHCRCEPCNHNLDKLHEQGDQLRKSCHFQLTKLKAELEQQFNANEETFKEILRDAKSHFLTSTQRLRTRISEIESLVHRFRDSAGIVERQGSPSKVVADLVVFT
jgi:hypothetical protein